MPKDGSKRAPDLRIFIYQCYQWYYVDNYTLPQVTALFDWLFCILRTVTGKNHQATEKQWLYRLRKWNENWKLRKNEVPDTQPDNLFGQKLCFRRKDNCLQLLERELLSAYTIHKSPEFVSEVEWCGAALEADDVLNTGLASHHYNYNPTVFKKSIQETINDLSVNTPSLLVDRITAQDCGGFNFPPSLTAPIPAGPSNTWQSMNPYAPETVAQRKGQGSVGSTTATLGSVAARSSIINCPNSVSLCSGSDGALPWSNADKSRSPNYKCPQRAPFTPLPIRIQSKHHDLPSNNISFQSPTNPTEVMPIAQPPIQLKERHYTEGAYANYLNTLPYKTVVPGSHTENSTLPRFPDTHASCYDNHLPRFDPQFTLQTLPYLPTAPTQETPSTSSLIPSIPTQLHPSNTSGNIDIPDMGGPLSTQNLDSYLRRRSKDPLYEPYNGGNWASESDRS